MKLREINKDEFLSFALTSDENNFFQTKEWAEFERLNGWHTYFLGLDHNGQIKAAAMIMSREIPIIKKRIFYSPRGLLINYKDLELVRSFTKHLKEFISERKGIFLRIDPYLSLKDLDSNGKYIQGGYNNDKCIDVLRSVGYIYKDFNFTMPNLLYTIDLKDKDFEQLFSSMSDEVINTVNTNKRKYISVRDINENEIEPIFEIINNNNSINYIDGDIKKFYEIFNKDKLLNIKIVEMDVSNYLKTVENEDEKLQASNIFYNYGNKVTLGCAISVCYGKEVTTVCTVINEKFKDFLAKYTLNYELIRWAVENGYETYNFYGIGDKIGDDNLLYQYYKGFNGKVVKLLGEFDLVVNPTLYKMYYKYSKRRNLKITDFKKKK